MRAALGMLGAVVFLFIGSSTIQAQEHHVVSSSAVGAAVLDRANGADADRARVLGFLRQPEVQSVAAGAGMDASTLENAVGTMGDAELKSLVQRLDGANELAGGDALIISSTAVIIGLLILILVLVAD